MPTYEYACTACGHRLEAVQKFTDDALTECPDCGGKLRKVFGAPGIVLKGSGFYKTDTPGAGQAGQLGEVGRFQRLGLLGLGHEDRVEHQVDRLGVQGGTREVRQQRRQGGQGVQARRIRRHLSPGHGRRGALGAPGG